MRPDVPAKHAFFSYELSLIIEKYVNLLFSTCGPAYITVWTPQTLPRNLLQYEIFETVVFRLLAICFHNSQITRDGSFYGSH